MLYSSKEDRLNPVAPGDADETTLGGYIAIHGRAPGFDASDGSPYTAAVENEELEGGKWAGYLIFLRWADHGSAIMGHLETDDLVTADSAEEARGMLERLPLTKVKEILEETIASRSDDTPRQGFFDDENEEEF